MTPFILLLDYLIMLATSSDSILPVVTGDYPAAVQSYEACRAECGAILVKHTEETNALIASMAGMSPAELAQADRDLVTLNQVFVLQAKELSERTKRAQARIYQ